MCFLYTDAFFLRVYNEDHVWKSTHFFDST